MATVKSIVYKPKGQKEARDQIGYLRVSLTEANLIEGYGIEGDRKGGSPKRQLNVMDDLTLAELQTDGYPTEPGALGENIILSGIDLRKLPNGTQLQLGNEAVIVLGKPREPCEQLTPLDERMPESVENRVGIMCRVIKYGRVRVGDMVQMISEPIPH